MVLRVRHFLKHHVYSLCSRSSTHPFPVTDSRFLSFVSHQERGQGTHTSSFIRKIASSSTSASNYFDSQYLSVRVWCGKDVAEVLSEALLCFGASSTSVDEGDAHDSTAQICVDTIFPDGEDVAKCISHAADSVGLKQIPRFEVKIGEQHDWIKKVQESFQPVQVTEDLWVVPQWSAVPDVQATKIVLNPGLAFGTGEHPTTQLCLLLLKSLIKGGELFLDYGTGSGVLAIAAIKFGAALSVGIDIAPQAIASARENAGLNDIGPEKMQLHLISSGTNRSLAENARKSEAAGQNFNEMDTISEKDQYDVVIANILLNPLLDLADHIVSLAKPGAAVGLSGFLSEQVPYIIERYSQYLDCIHVSEMEDWACVSGRKKADRFP